jgi:hypothetical protein
LLAACGSSSSSSGSNASGAAGSSGGSSANISAAQQVVAHDHRDEPGGQVRARG